MEIIQVTSAHQRDDIRIYKKISTSLAEYFQITLIVADGKEDLTLKNNIKIESVPKAKSRLYRFIITPFVLLNKILKHKKTIIHLHDPELIHIGLILKILNYKVIFDSHESLSKQILSKEYLNKHIAFLLSKTIKIYEISFFRFFDSIICATEQITEELLHTNKNVICLNNYPILINKEKNETKRDNNTIVYIGSISKIRGIIQLIESLEFSTKVEELRLIGSFNNLDLEKYVKTLNGWNKVKYYGQLDSEEANYILTKSQVGLVTFLPAPNHIQSQPNKLFEYLESKTPVIVSNFEKWKELIDEYKCGIAVDPTNPRLIAEAIDNLLANKNIDEIGKNGYKAITSKYSWEKEKEKLIKIYNHIL